MLGGMRHYTVLVTGFETPEGGDATLSPTTITARRLGGADTLGRLRARTGLDLEVTPVLLPLSFRRGWPALEQAIRDNRPCLTVVLGHKGGIHGVTLERSAINRIQTDRPDNDGVQPLPSAIIENGPAAFWTRLPLSRVLSAFADAHVPASLSSDAGTYVCNMLFYRLMDFFSRTPDQMGGLMCLPDFSKPSEDVTAGKMGLSPDQMLTAGEELIATTLVYEQRALEEKEAGAAQTARTV